MLTALGPRALGPGALGPFSGRLLAVAVVRAKFLALGPVNHVTLFVVSLYFIYFIDQQ